jgi:hypothetical protein
MEIIGKNTIDPLFFYTGKLSGYFTWIAMLLAFFNISIIEKPLFQMNSIVYIPVLFISLVFIVLS